MSSAGQSATEIDSLMEGYYAWLRDRTSLKAIRNWTEITTPFLDCHNDCIQLYAKREDGGFILNDDGHTLTDLEMSGCSLSSPKRQALLQTTLNGFGVKLVKDVIQVSATADNFAMRKHNLVQAVLAVNDLFYLASSAVKSLFLEDVAAWLDESGIRYLPHVKLPGASNFDHVFDFAIPKSRQSPERLLRTIGNPDREAAQNFAFAWLDTREARPANAVAYAVINDNDRPVPPTVTDAFAAYGIHSAPWSEREMIKRALAG